MSLLTGEPAGGQAAAAAPVADNSGGAGAAAAGGTIVGGSSVPASAASAGADWRSSLPAELKDNQLLASFKSIDSLAKSYVHQSQLVGKKGVIPPTDKSSDEERAAFWDSIGRPAIDKYEVALPEGAKVQPEVLNQFKQVAHQLGILPKQAEGLLKFQTEIQKQSEDFSAKAKEEASKVQLDALKKEWGQGWDKNVAAAQFAVQKMDGDTKELSQHLAKSGLGNDVVLIKHLAKMGDMIATLTKESPMVGAGGSYGKTPAEINSEIQKLTAHPGYADAMHGDHKRLVDEVARLYQARSNQRSA